LRSSVLRLSINVSTADAKASPETTQKEQAVVQATENDISAELRAKLRELAAAVAQHSYSPYSHFRVGAALLLSDRTIVTGCNVENASYRLTSCAEQAAIARAISQHGPAIRLRAVAVANLNDSASMPCGACRQTLAEFGDDDTLILYPAEHGAPAETTLGALLPDAFRGTFLDSK
jgi:cytidine deaminase